MYGLFGVQEAEREAVLLCREVVHVADGLDEGREVDVEGVELHLLPVDLAHVQYLVDQAQDALRVVVYDVEFGLVVLVGRARTQLLERRQDEGQRRADVVGGVDEELHLVLVELPAYILPIGIGGVGQQGQQQQGIHPVGPRRPPPGRKNLDGVGRGVGVRTGQQGPHAEPVFARCQMVEGDGVAAAPRGLPARFAVDAVFEDHVGGIGKVQ